MAQLLTQAVARRALQSGRERSPRRRSRSPSRRRRAHRAAESATQVDRLELQQRFLDLAASERDGRRYIRSIRSGPQINPEGAGGGFAVEFASEGDRNHYVGRPFVGDADYDVLHDAFKNWAGPRVRDVLVFDFAAGTAV